jgi:hypothetical protein
MTDIYLTPAQARETFPCPVARTFDQKVGPNCDGDRCILWRWRAIMASDALFQSAVKREMACLAQEEGNNKPPMTFHKKAAANVAANPEGYGVKREVGYCGLGGVPT